MLTIKLCMWMNFIWMNMNESSHTYLWVSNHVIAAGAMICDMIHSAIADREGYVDDSRDSALICHMGWLWLVGSIKLQVSLAEYSLFYRSLLQKRPIILSILLTEATPYDSFSDRIATICLLQRSRGRWMNQVTDRCNAIAEWIIWGGFG